MGNLLHAMSVVSRTNHWRFCCGEKRTNGMGLEKKEQKTKEYKIIFIVLLLDAIKQLH